jgi:DNA-binding helix-hairpin-helix protein with protein kinase domain
MRAASILHTSHCVIGDVNESNIFVLADGTVRLIDVDSFQVHYNGDVFPCNVGTPIYTPPELQRTTFRNVLRTPNHDIFGLSVLVFQLLVQGCHPFAGRLRDGHCRTIEEAISEGLFAYSIHRRHLIEPPPGRLALAELGELAELFERSFLQTQRPTATDWATVLERTRGKLVRCAKNPRHSFVRDCRTCPLCKLPRDPLPYYGEDAGGHVDLGGLSLHELIRQAGELKSLRPLIERCGEADIPSYERSVPANPPGSLAASQHSNKVSGSAVAGWWLVIVGIVLFFQVPEIGICCVILGVLFLHGASEQAAAETRVRESAAMRAYEPLRQAALTAIERLRQTEALAHSLSLSASATIQSLWKVAAEKRALLLSANDQLEHQLRNADVVYREQKLTEYLERYIIAHASIADIGPSRKAVLASFGVETAADVDPITIKRVPGFGPHLTERLVSWRRSCERNFQPGDIVKAPPDWLQRIHQQHNATLATTAIQLKRTIEEYRAVHLSYDKQFSEVSIQLDLARRDCRTAIRAVRSA